jgi:hypothetical protein
MGATSSTSEIGVFGTLRQQFGADLVKAGHVKVSASGTGMGNPSTLIDGRCAERWYSDNSESAWLCFEFPKHTVCLTAYQFACDSTLPDAGQPQSWVIQGSLDRSTWITIDERRRDQRLNREGKISGTFVCHRSPPLKIIRITQTERNTFRRESHHLVLYGVEFYGALESEE